MWPDDFRNVSHLVVSLAAWQVAASKMSEQFDQLGSEEEAGAGLILQEVFRSDMLVFT